MAKWSQEKAISEDLLKTIKDYEAAILSTPTYEKMSTKSREEIELLFALAKRESLDVLALGELVRTFFVLGVKMARCGVIDELPKAIAKSREALQTYKVKEERIRQLISEWSADLASHLWEDPAYKNCKIMEMCDLISECYLPNYLHELRKESMLVGNWWMKIHLGMQKGKENKGKYKRETLSSDTIYKYLKAQDKISPFIPRFATQGGGRKRNTS